MKTWKTRLNGGHLDEKTPETYADLKRRRDALLLQAGTHQYSIAVWKAQLINMNQDILNINQKLDAMDAEELKRIEAMEASAHPVTEIPVPQGV